MHTKHITLTQARLKEYLHYDPETGVFKWIKNPGGRVKAGQIAGSIRSDGRTYIRILGVQVLSYRLAWFYTHGVWPVSIIDHINRDPTDNRLANLREATHAENSQNTSRIRTRARRSKTADDLYGAHWNRGRWNAQINSKGKQIHLGRYDTPEEAHAAYKGARAALDAFSSSDQ